MGGQRGPLVCAFSYSRLQQLLYKDSNEEGWLPVCSLVEVFGVQALRGTHLNFYLMQP